MKRSFIRRALTIAAVTVMIAGMISLTGCGKYTSSYITTMCVTSNESDSAFMSFSSFKGTRVFKMSTDDGDSLSYSASLGKGKAAVYYDNNGGKELLFEINGGDEISGSLEDLSEGKIYVIIESDGEMSEGRFDLDIK